MRPQPHIHLIHTIFILHIEHKVNRLQVGQAAVDQRLVLCGGGQSGHWTATCSAPSPGPAPESTPESSGSSWEALKRAKVNHMGPSPHHVVCTWRSVAQLLGQGGEVLDEVEPGEGRTVSHGRISLAHHYNRYSHMQYQLVGKVTWLSRPIHTAMVMSEPDPHIQPRLCQNQRPQQSTTE